MSNIRKPKPGAIATRRGHAAWKFPLVRHKPPVTNREWQEQRRKAREADIFEKLFGKLLEKVKS
jgi:hypothetical protein